ncbi:Rab family GTPase [Sandaracinus amylolyticus]|uniref:Rab family GTPase n=1 Tax=Sandaracinus amylolyticus TaxID=927083 RepID=UPI001F1F86CB|nr:Rab family GTPase [Sandaracinus amylolyticus]UJR82718.1 Hypothetical protein I5071_47830 [Sandaracinus amylolyticus]
MSLKLKLCMIGATGVGKTSLVARYVHSVFSERYETTIGVKILSRRVMRDERPVDLVVWDLSGEDEFQNVQPAYLRGAAGYLLVADGTRRDTLDVASVLNSRAQAAIRGIPFVVAINKADMVAAWEIRERDTAQLAQRGWPCVLTSAKTGAGVDRAFDLLVDAILAGRRSAWT